MSDKHDFKGPWKWHIDDPQGQYQRPDIYLEDATGDCILHANADYSTHDAWIEAEPEIKRLIAAAPDMYKFVKLAADGGNHRAKVLMAQINDEEPPTPYDRIDDVECPGLTCDGKKAEVYTSFAGGTTYVCRTCGFKWEEPCY